MNKYTKTAYCLSILLVIFLAGLVRGSEGQDDGILRIGVSLSGFVGINENDATAALKAWADSLGREMGLAQVDVTLMTNPIDEFRTALEENRLDGMSVSVAEYIDLGLKVTEVYVGITENGPGISYAVIVGKDAAISSPEDLLGRKLVMGKDRRMGLAKPWLQTLMTDRDGRPDGTIFQEPTVAENPSKAILQVFFHQADAALVVSEAFDLACELNPQLQKKLRVMAESPSFITDFFLFPHSADHSRKTEKLKNAILDLSSTPGGRQVLTVIKSNRIKRFPVSVLDNTIQCLTTYRSMMNKALSQDTPP